MDPIAWPSLSSRTRPTKLASAPTSLRPRASASSSRPTSKSASWMRTRGTSASGDGREEGDLVARLERRRGIGHLLVDGDAPALAGGERLGPALVAIAQLLEQARHGRVRVRKRDLLARAADALAQAGEVEDRHHEGQRTSRARFSPR